MQYFLLGLATVVFGLIVAQAFMRANPAALAVKLRLVGGIAALGGAGFLFFRGGTGYALPLAGLGAWLLWGQGGPPLGWPGRGGPSTGQTSTVTTEHLEMELDHDTGAMRGRVLKGFFAGRDLEGLKPVELAHLWQDCRFNDPQSAQLVEAYLDRVHPSWRDDLARGEAEHTHGPDGKMTAAQALEILGLPPNASDDDIRRAHRELMLKLHPDRGGSTYLAAKINEAKDVLLARRSD
ncbi:MAG: DnaJ domain-containing protein [Sphingomonadales bacterium]|nr:DnaJ domain-containing protein [Sphingomonadales bacterium]